MVRKGMAILFATTGLLLFVCNLSTNKTNNSGKATNVSQLFPTETDISGWKKNTTDGYSTWSAANFVNDMDGGFEKYTDRGMIECGDISMDGPNGTHILHKSFIMDYGLDSTALAMYNYQKDYYSNGSLDITGYDKTVAFAYPVIGGVTAFAHFKKFYFELQFANFSDQTLSIQAAAQFLGMFKSKIE